MSTRALSVTLGILILLAALFLWGGKSASHTAPEQMYTDPMTEINSNTTVTHTMPDGTVMHVMPDGSMMAN